MGWLHDFTIGLISAIVAVLLMQNLPVSVRWSKQIRERNPEPDEDARLQVFQAALTRKWWYPRWWEGPIDVEFRARFVRFTSSHWERILEIPVDKDWRPQVAKTVQTRLLVHEVNPDDMGSGGWDDSLRRKASENTLTIRDLFEKYPGGVLRLYALGSHRRTGTRWYSHTSYKEGDVRFGEWDTNHQQVIPRDGH